MDTLGAVVGSLGFLALIVGAVMFIPIAALRSQRSLAKKLAISGGVAFAIGLILSPTVPPTPVAEGSKEKTPATVARKAAPSRSQPTATGAISGPPRSVVAPPADAALAKAMSDRRETVLSYLRTSQMQVIFCTGEVDYTQTAIEKVSAGTANTMQAYSAAHAGERDCKKASNELAQLEKAPFAVPRWNEMFARVLPSCRSTTREGASAMTIAKNVLDGNPSLAKAQEYKDARNAMIGKALECKMGFLGLAEEAGLPKEQVEFLR